jgi:UTP--glucose-1-phosphate uridylyltransferase
LKKIRKAVFPVAGLGTRFLPATKAMPKELLPIINKPLIQYAAEEAILAGIDTLIFITGRNKRAIEDHFDRNLELENILHLKGDNIKAQMIRNILPAGIECIFVRQPEQLGLGHAVLCAERVIGNEPFAVILADDFLMSNGLGVTLDLVKAFEKSRNTQISVMPINGSEIAQYGVINPSLDTNSVISIVEKPEYLDAPSNLASIGRYILTSEIFPLLREQNAGINGEIQLTDAINLLANDGKVEFLPFSDGKRFDCGSVNGYIEAINYVANQEIT